MLSLSARGMPARGPGRDIFSTRAASASSSSWDQCSVAFKPAARVSRSPVSAATAAAPPPWKLPPRPTVVVTDPPWRRVAAPGKIRRGTPEPAPPAAGPAAQHLPGLPEARQTGDQVGKPRRCGRPIPDLAGLRTPRCDSFDPPAGPAPPQERRAPPALPRGAPHPCRYSCALPFPFETSIGHQELLDPDLLVVEGD